MNTSFLSTTVLPSPDSKKLLSGHVSSLNFWLLGIMCRTQSAALSSEITNAGKKYTKSSEKNGKVSKFLVFVISSRIRCGARYIRYLKTFLIALQVTM